MNDNSNQNLSAVLNFEKYREKIHQEEVELEDSEEEMVTLPRRVVEELNYELSRIMNLNK